MQHSSHFINMFNLDLEDHSGANSASASIFHYEGRRGECKRNAPVSGSLPGLLFARWVLPLLPCVAWKSPFLCSNLSWKRTRIKKKLTNVENYTEPEQDWTTTVVMPPEMDSNRQIWFLLFKRKHMLWVVALFWLDIVCEETTWGIWKRTFTCGQLIVCPIGAVTYPVTQDVFVCIWDRHLARAALKFTFHRKGGRELRLIREQYPFIWHLGPSPIQSWHE